MHDAFLIASVINCTQVLCSVTCL